MLEVIIFVTVAPRRWSGTAETRAALMRTEIRTEDLKFIMIALVREVEVIGIEGCVGLNLRMY